MSITRKIEVETDHPRAEQLIQIGAEDLADRLDRFGISFVVRVTDAVGQPLWENTSFNFGKE